MRKGVFAPYTKQQAVRILRNYFGFTRDKAEQEVLRLSACVVRDGLDVSKYLYIWENKALSGITGAIQELNMLYPFYQAITLDAAIKSFKKVYSERDIMVNNCNIFGEKAIVTAEFPDGTFYFVVTERSVSSAYRSFEDAQKAIG